MWAKTKENIFIQTIVFAYSDTISLNNNVNNSCQNFPTLFSHRFQIKSLLFQLPTFMCFQTFSTPWRHLFKKSPLCKLFSKAFVFVIVFERCSVDDTPKRIERYLFSKKIALVWMNKRWKYICTWEKSQFDCIFLLSFPKNNMGCFSL